MLLVLSLTSSPEGQNTPEFIKNRPNYILAVLPQFPPVEVYKRWTPLVERLSKELGINIQLKVYQKTQEFEADVLKGVPDFALVNPYFAIQAKGAQGYTPLVRDKKSIRGIIFVRRDSPIDSIQRLNDKEVAFVGSKTICSLLLGYELSKGKIHFTPRYMGTSSNVYRAVILDKAPAGGTLDTSLKREPAAVGSQLRIIYETPMIASHPLMAHPRVSEGLRQAVLDTVLQLAGDKNNHNIFEEILMLKPVKADYQRDYAPLEKLKLEKYIFGGE